MSVCVDVLVVMDCVFGVVYEYYDDLKSVVDEFVFGLVYQCVCCYMKEYWEVCVVVVELIEKVDELLFLYGEYWGYGGVGEVIEEYMCVELVFVFVCVWGVV